jgi:hypothetical protein
VDFQDPPPEAGRSSADPEKNQQVRILFDPLQGFLIPGRENDLGNDRFPTLPFFLPNRVMDSPDGFENDSWQSPPHDRHNDGAVMAKSYGEMVSPSGEP